jgi:ZIP family zinc transporter
MPPDGVGRTREERAPKRQAASRAPAAMDAAEADPRGAAGAPAGTGAPEGTSAPPRRGRVRDRSPRWAAAAALPVLAVGALLAWLLVRGIGLDDRGLPPVEELSITRVELPAPGQLRLHVVNSGPQPSRISQVLVDEAYWSFRIQPGNVLGRLDRAVVDVPYPWVFSEPHEVTLLTSTGLTFSAEVPVAVESPRFSWDALVRFGVLGVYVGVLPVALGLLLYPFLRRLGARGMDFLLALTIGLLVFLVVDTLLEALEIAGEVPGVYQGQPLVLLAGLVTVLALLAVGRLGRGHRGFTPLAVAYLIALGIGLHNLGEGLAIGAAFTLGELALGSFLVIGFTLHNITEGIGIAAPILRDRPPLRHFGFLVLLAGFPAAIGTWIGAFSYSPLASAVFLGIGAGAIAQVIYEVTRLLSRRSAEGAEPLLSGWNFAGLLAGIAIMYGTALLVAV